MKVSDRTFPQLITIIKVKTVSSNLVPSALSPDTIELQLTLSV